MSRNVYSIFINVKHTFDIPNGESIAGDARYLLVYLSNTNDLIGKFPQERERNNKSTGIT